MLERIKGNIEANREGFSLAEMLIVLLIISFLVLAMPPIVHKKVQKRITRGEHGRYECWVSPQDMTVDGVTYQKGKTYEYYATEKNGPCADCGEKGNPKGYIPTGGQCTFKPKEMAPNAAYFSFNVIGGGAGGSYAPYDSSDKMYKDSEAAVTANVRLGKYVCTEGKPNIDGTCPPSSGRPTGENPANWSWYGKIYEAGAGNCNVDKISSLGFRKPINGGTDSITFSWWAAETEHYAYNYKNSIEAYDELPRTKDWVKYYWYPVSLTNQYLTFCSGNGYTGAPVANSGSHAGSEYYKYFYGGPGGKGVCVSLKPKESLPVGMNYPSLGSDNYFKVARAKRDNPEYFFYVLNRDYRNTTKLVSMEKTRLTDDFDLPKAATNPEISNGGVEPSPGAYTHQNICGNSFEGNFVYLGGTKETPDLLVLPGGNGHEATSAVSTEISQAGETVTVGDETINFTGKNAADRIADLINAENSIWRVVSTNDNFSASIPNLEGASFFPSSIVMTRKYGFDSTTFGYPGEPGESISMFLPNLTGNLTFQIGQGGDEGSATSKTGGSGSPTSVKNSDGVNIFTAKGGVGHMGGEIGSKVLMFGEDILKGRGEESSNPMKLSSVCESGVTFGSKKDEDGYPLLIDGCLDKGVRDNEKRFSADSGFYTILELDTNTKTPSVINKLYGSIDDGGSGMLPGSGGDGGYSFLRDTRGTETIHFDNHPQKHDDTVYDYNYTYTDGTGTKHPTITQNYTCYRKKENIGEASGDKVTTTVCEPSRGYPGAVVIVW